MTLLTIIQDAADEVGASIRPDTVIGNVDPDAQRFLRIANRVGEYLKDCSDWQALRGEQTFTADAAEAQTSALPSDFDRFVPETFWDRTNTRLLVGPIDAKRWQAEKAHSYDLSVRLFALRGGAVFVQPAFTGAESCAFEYVSVNWCTDSLGTGQSTWTADTDLAVLSEELHTLGVIAGYNLVQGFPQAAAAAGAFQDRINMLLRTERSSDANVTVAADIFAGVRHYTGEPRTSHSDIAY